MCACVVCFCTWSARCTFGEALDSQTLTTLLASPSCATLGINALLDTVPVRFRDAKFVKQVTCRDIERKNVITLIISKYSLQMILSHHRNWMQQQTYNQLKNETGNARLCFFSWGNMLLHINFSSASFFFLVKAEQVDQKSPGSAPASTYLSHAKSACNYTHTARRKQEFIEFTETLQMCPAGGRSYSEQTLVLQ